MTDQTNTPAETTTPARVKQNGIVLPLPGSNSGILWDIFNAASTEAGPVPFANVKDQCEATGISMGTSRSAYQHWRKYNGFAGANPVLVAAKAAKAAQEAQLKAEEAAQVAATRAAKAQAEADAKAAKVAAKAAKTAAKQAAKAAADTTAA